MNTHIDESPAEIYDRHFVPALFAGWASVVADAAKLAPGQRVLDVACGTGVLTIAAAERVGMDGSVVGLDPNEDMLSVARKKEADIEWRNGQAESIPFPDNHFDAAVSQFGFMFFDDQTTALREMMRVLRPGGNLTVAVCDALDHSPGYAVLAELLHRLFGAKIAQAFRAPFSSGDRGNLLALCEAADLAGATLTRHDRPVYFESIDALVSTERACAWTLGGLLDESQFERLRLEAAETLKPFETASRAVRFTMAVLIIQYVKS